MTLFFSPVSTGMAERVPCSDRGEQWVESTRRAKGEGKSEYAKFRCGNCPVLDACREWACSDPDPCPQMVAGGLTTRERNVIRLRATNRIPVRPGSMFTVGVAS